MNKVEKTDRLSVLKEAYSFLNHCRAIERPVLSAIEFWAGLSS